MESYGGDASSGFLIGDVVANGTIDDILYVGTGKKVAQNDAFKFDHTNLYQTITVPVASLTTRTLNYWVDSTDPNAKKFALTLGSGGLWVNGSAREDIVMNFGYNLNAQGPIDAGDIAWGLQFETFACRGAQLSQTTGDVEFWLCYTEPGGFSVRPIGVDVDRTTHISDIYLVSTNYNFNGQAASGSYTATAGWFSYTGMDPAGGSQTTFIFTSPTYTANAAGAEKLFVNFDDQSNNWTWATGALALQRFVLIGAPTIKFAADSTCTTAASLYINGAPVAGLHATIINSFALATNGGDVLFDTGGGLVGMWWQAAAHTLKIMNSAVNYVTLAHDGTNGVLTSATGQLNLNASGSSTVSFGNNFYSMQWTNATLAGNTDNVMILGTAAKRMSDVGATALSAYGANGQSCRILQLTELTTIAAAATTDTAIQIPAGAIVLAVSVRVTVVIPTAATFTVTATTGGTQFNTGTNVSTAANTTDAGTKAGAFYQAAASLIRITPNAQPAANTGRVRVTIYYVLSTAPTS